MSTHRTALRQWKTRNTLYLRISRDCVLSMLLYLDQTHVGWMNDVVLERVLENLRERIRLKLRKESGSGSKKSIVDVYRGAGWQMAYYFRQTAQKHAVLLKDKQIVMEAPSKPQAQSRAPARDAYDLDIQIDDEDGSSSSLPPAGDGVTLDEDEEKTLKPKLHVSYAGFAIFGRTLVVVVEPYPPLTEQQIREASIAPASETRELSAVPSSRTRPPTSMPPPSTPPRRDTEMPLFRSETPMSVVDPDEDLDGFRARSQSIVRVFNVDDDIDEDLEVLDSPQGERPRSLVSRLEDLRDTSEVPTDLSIRQYLSPALTD